MVGHYYKSDDINTMVPISLHDYKVAAILDEGAGVNIITKK